MEELRYGEKILKEFDIEKDLEIWENKQSRDYMIKITLPEFCCLCPRSGYPDFATINLEYIPNKFVVELKALKLYINSFMNRNISHEDSINEIYSALEKRLEPKFMKIVGDFNPRGNVHTVIEICSQSVLKQAIPEPAPVIAAPAAEIKFERRERGEFKEFRRDSDRSERKRDSKPAAKRERSFDKSSDKGGERKRAPKKEGFKKPEFLGEKRAKVVKKDK